MTNHEMIRKLESKGFIVSKIVDGLGKKKWQVKTKFTTNHDSNLRELYKTVTR